MNAIEAASAAYTQALWNYEDTLASRDAERIAGARAALTVATRNLSAAQIAVVLARQASPPVTFTTLLGDPTQQLDPDGVVMRSITDYQNATTNTPSADGGNR
jgi:hypothetical protein